MTSYLATFRKPASKVYYLKFAAQPSVKACMGVSMDWCNGTESFYSEEKGTAAAYNVHRRTQKDKVCMVLERIVFSSSNCIVS